MASRGLAAARRMRKAPAANEAKLWRLLRHRKLAGLKFRRQVPLGGYVADFVCFRHRLVIEADGPFHDPEADATRDAWLASQGFRVLRFKNDLIATSPELVLITILEAVEVPPSPLAGEGVGEADG